jgi:RPA family protein
LQHVLIEGGYLAQQIKRQIAEKIRIADLKDGQYIKEEGLRPNYVMLKNGHKVSRVNLVGTVVSNSTDLGYRDVCIDDGSAKMSVRAFEQNPAMDALSIGDPIFIIGRPREYGQEIYVLPEIIKKIENMKWLEVRQLELAKIKIIPETSSPQEDLPEEEPEEPVEEVIEDKGVGAVKEAIRGLDSGSGADYEDITMKVGPDADKIISSMLKNGDVFEVSPGKLKLLE